VPARTQGVDGQDGVEGAIEGGRQLIDRGPVQADPSGGDGGGVAAGGLVEHHLGVVDAVHVALVADAAAQLGDRQARTKADLQDPVGGLHLQQRDHPAVALAVGRAVRHHPAGNPAGRAVGVMALANDVVIQDPHRGKSKARNRALDGRGHGLLHRHGLLAVTSHALDPSSRPSGVT
jgi:hypothetical protein